MLSNGTENSRALSTADARVMFPSMLPPPSRAATSTARRSFAYVRLRFWSVASFLRLMVLHLEWPDTALHLPQQVPVQAAVADELRVERCHDQRALLETDRPP